MISSLIQKKKEGYTYTHVEENLCSSKLRETRNGVFNSTARLPSKPGKTRFIKAALYASRTPTCLLNLALLSFPLSLPLRGAGNVDAAIPPGETVSCVASHFSLSSLFASASCFLSTSSREYHYTLYFPNSPWISFLSLAFLLPPLRKLLFPFFFFFIIIIIIVLSFHQKHVVIL